MKKIISLFLILLAAFQVCFLTACNKKPKKFTDYSFDFFDTVTTIVGYEQSQEVFEKNCEKIKGWLSLYHRLYDIYTTYENITNLCTINMSQGEEVAVSKEIIDLLVYSKEQYITTSGKLNIAMGSVLSIWHDYREYGLNNPEKASLY